MGSKQSLFLSVCVTWGLRYYTSAHYPAQPDVSGCTVAVLSAGYFQFFDINTFMIMFLEMVSCQEQVFHAGLYDIK